MKRPVSCHLPSQQLMLPKVQSCDTADCNQALIIALLSHYVCDTNSAASHCTALHTILLMLQDHNCRLHAHTLCFTAVLSYFCLFFQDAEKLIIEHITQSNGKLPQATASLLAQHPGLLPGSVNGQAAVQVGSFSTDTQDQLRQLVAEELSQATQKAVAAQVLGLKPCDCPVIVSALLCCG